MGTKRWDQIYTASTPEEAASLGLKLPGEDKVCVSIHNATNIFFGKSQASFCFQPPVTRSIHSLTHLLPSESA